MKNRFLLAFLVLLPLFVSMMKVGYAQPPVIDISHESDICLEENLIFYNNTTAEEFVWDFCTGDMEETPNADVIYTSGPFTNPFGMDLLYDGIVWRAFLPSSNKSSLYQAQFNDGLKSTPVVSDLGDYDGKISSPSAVSVIEVGGNFYGFVANRGNGTITRIEFGTDLTASPIRSTDLGDFGAVSSPDGIKVIQESNTSFKLFITYGNQVGIVNLGSDLSASPIGFSAFTIADASRLWDIDVIFHDGNWYGIVSSHGSDQIFHLSFGATLDTTVTPNELPYSGLTVDAPVDINFIKDGENFYAVFQTRNTASLFKYSFGSSPSNLTPGLADLGNFGVFNVSAFGMSVAYDSSEWVIMHTNSLEQLSYASFKSDCGIAIQTSTDQSPQILYTSAGTKNISMEALNNEGSSFYYGSVNVSGNSAPTITFTYSENECLGQPNFFTTMDDGDLDYEWSFNGGLIIGSTDKNPEHTFEDVGDSLVILTVTHQITGCQNEVNDIVSIYPLPPTPLFTASDPPYCTNDEIFFTNDISTNESNHGGANVTYTWDYGDGGSGDNSQDGSFVYTSPGEYDVKLEMSIPGCSVQSGPLSVTTVDGPAVDFTYSNNCFGEDIQFTDLTVGQNITLYAWDFGDFSTIVNDQNPTHSFTIAGDYNVSLTVFNEGGCSTTTTREVSISNLPKVDFTYGESIENLPVDFTGLDLTLADDEVESWLWDFAGQAVSIDSNPSHTFNTTGDFLIELEVTTTQGCSETIQKTISVEGASCPTASFILEKNTFCINEPIEVTNTSVNSTSYYWSLCNDALSNPVSGSNTISENANFAAIYAIQFLPEENTGIGIRNNGRLYYAQMDDSLNILENMDTFSDELGKYSSPRDIKIIRHESGYIGLVSNSGNTSITRLIWESTDLTLDPVVDVVEDITTLNNTNGIELVKNDESIVALVGKNLNNGLSILDFGNDFESVPTVNNLHIGGISGIQGISLTKECGIWIGLVTSLADSKLIKLVWENGLSNSPNEEEIVVSDIEWVNPAKVKLIADQGLYYGFVQTQNGNVFEFEFGSSMYSTPSVTQIPALSDGCYGIDVVQNTFDRWRLFAVNNSTVEGLYSKIFDESCDFSTQTSIDDTPVLSNGSAGVFDLKLTAYNEDGNTNYSTQSITILSEISPEISFSIDDNRCVENSNSFNAIDNGTVTNYSWDFDNDGLEDDNEANPVFNFETVGDFVVRLTADNGSCLNFVEDTITIFPAPPVPSFETTGAPYCTNATIEFTNTTDESDHEGTTISYQWNFNDQGSSSQNDTAFNFLTAGSKNISLTMSIPGCSTPYNQMIDLVSGPNNDFTFENDCLGEEAEFNNLTTGDNLTNPLWDFGDGYSSTEMEPNHLYETPDDYLVTLTMENTSGCVNTLQQTVRINGVPNVSFDSDLACEGQTVQFTDTSMPGDDMNNIDSWTWDFDALGGATEANPQFLFDDIGDYDITLTVANTAGCQNFTTQTIQVQETPTIDFNVDLACLNEATVFEDLTESSESNPITSWFWQIEGESFTEQNPNKVFTEAGVYSANLIVTAQNLCAAVLQQDFEVFDLPNVSFDVENTCDNELTEFMDLSSSGAGNIVSRTWTFGELGTANGQNTAFEFTESGDYNIGLRVADELGCENGIDQMLTINPAPIANFTVSSDLGPPPLAIDFTNQSEGASNSLWQFNDENNTTSIEENPSFAYETFGTYHPNLISTSEEGCSDTTSMEIAVAIPTLDLELLEITSEEVNGKIDLTLRIANQGSLPVNGFDIRIDIENQSSIFESYNEVLWRQTTINLPLNFSLSATNSNVEFVCITLIDREEDYEDVDLFNNEGCIQFDQEVEIENAYPNPISDNTSDITLQMVLPAKSPVEITLINSLGKVVYQQLYNDVDAGLNTFLIEIQGYRKGMYFVRVAYNNTTSTQKIVKI